MTSRHVRAGARVQNNGHSNVRHSTNGLDTDQVKELNSAWHHAATIGLPLNSFVSVRPIDIDDMSPAERCRRFAVIRNKLGVYARLRGFEPTSIWSREVNPDGTGEHLHVIAISPASIFRISKRRSSAGFRESVKRMEAITWSGPLSFAWRAGMGRMASFSKQVTLHRCI